MQGVWRAHCHPYTPSSVTLCFYLRSLKPPSMPMEPRCVPPCSPFPEGSARALPRRGHLPFQAVPAAGSTASHKGPHPLGLPLSLLTGMCYQQGQAKTPILKQQIVHMPGTSVWHSLNFLPPLQKNITQGHAWLQGTSHSMRISPAKLSSASALLYECYSIYL